MRTLLVLVAACGVLATAAPAFAVDFCVAPNTTCGGVQVGDLQSALDVAGLSDNADRIFLGADTYDAPFGGFDYNAPTAPVEIIGAGRANTLLTGPANGATRVLSLLGGPGTSLRDLQVVMPRNMAMNAIGIDTNGLVENVSLVEDNTQANARVGLELEGGTLDHSFVDLSVNGDDTAVALDAKTSAVRDSSVVGKYGIISNQGGTIERSKVYAGDGGVFAYKGVLTIRSSRIDFLGALGLGAGSGGSVVTINADGVDVIGSGLGSNTAVEADNSAAAGTYATVNLTNSLIRGVSTALRAQTAALATGTATISASYSDYDGSGNASSGPKSVINESHISNVGDAGFVMSNYEQLAPSSP